MKTNEAWVVYHILDGSFYCKNKYSGDQEDPTDYFESATLLDEAEAKVACEMWNKAEEYGWREENENKTEEEYPWFEKQGPWVAEKIEFKPKRIKHVDLH